MANPVTATDPYGLNPLWHLWRDRAKDAHRNRNQYNRCPSREPGKYQCGFEDVAWINDEFGGNFFHGGFNTYRGTGRNRGSQCVYSKDGHLIDSGPYMGTCDFEPPFLNLGLPDPFGLVITHPIFDVIPHIIEPNYTPDLTTQY